MTHVRLIFASLSLAPLTAHGELVERFWTNPAGGSFQDQANWDGPIPGEGDTAVFALPSGYTVTLNDLTVTDRLAVRDGFVDLAMNGMEYELVGASLQLPSLIIGDDPRFSPGLTVEDGFLHAAHTSIGHTAGSFGSLQFSGSTTALLNDLSLKVGRMGIGSLTIGGQAQVTTYTGLVGGEDAGIGLVTVTGQQSRLDVLSELTVGEQGSADVSVLGGGVLSTGSAFIGQHIGSFGEVNVLGAGSTWLVNGNLDVGQIGTGSLNVSGGSTVHTTGFATIGTFPEPFWPPMIGGDGSVLVTGAGSTWMVDGDLYVAFGYLGELAILNGGAVFCSAGSLAVSSFVGQSQATVSGPGSLWSAATSIVVNNPLMVLDEGVVSCPQLEIQGDGELSGDGVVQGAVLCGGTIEPGELSGPYYPLTGTLTIDGDLHLTSSCELIVEVDGTVSYPQRDPESDLLDVSGEVVLDGTLHIIPIPPLLESDTFQIVSADVVSGQFAEVTAEPYPDWVWKVTYEEQAVWLEVCNPPPPGPADIDGNGVVDVQDLLLVILNWGPCPDPPDPCIADVGNSGAVNVGDLIVVLTAWAATDCF